MVQEANDDLIKGDPKPVADTVNKSEYKKE